jgi:hypothetical protein
MTNPTFSYSFKDIDGRAVVVSYHRQEKDLNRGRHPVVTFAPATRTDILAGAPGQRPLRVLIERHILAERLQGDDTSVPPSPRADGHRDRTREHPNRHLASYAGILQVDAFDGLQPPLSSRRNSRASADASVMRTVLALWHLNSDATAPNPTSSVLPGLIRFLRQLVDHPKEFARLANEEPVSREALDGSHCAPC